MDARDRAEPGEAHLLGSGVAREPRQARRPPRPPRQACERRLRRDRQALPQDLAREQPLQSLRDQVAPARRAHRRRPQHQDLRLHPQPPDTPYFRAWSEPVLNGYTQVHTTFEQVSRMASDLKMKASSGSSCFLGGWTAPSYDRSTWTIAAAGAGRRRRRARRGEPRGHGQGIPPLAARQLPGLLRRGAELSRALPDEHRRLRCPRRRVDSGSAPHLLEPGLRAGRPRPGPDPEGDRDQLLLPRHDDGRAALRDATMRRTQSPGPRTAPTSSRCCGCSPGAV